MKKKYDFEKLTLKDDVNIEVYEEALNYVFESDDIRNVAISGAYGAGKSSVLASYKKKHPNKKYIHISLAHFDSSEKEIDDKKSNTESVLEGKILNQLIHQIPSDSIPQTKFKVKENIKSGDIIKSAFLFMSLIVCIGFLCFFDEWKCFVELFSISWVGKVLSLTLNNYVRLVVGVIILAITYILIHSIIKLQKNKNIFKRLSVQGTEIEIFENQDESFFDKYLNEVLYLFENSQTDVIVFEDMDRFEINQIFERLREVNTLVNIQLAKNKEKKTLRFFYLLRDDVFVSKDRTKFFDYIIPVVPVVDGTNSYDQFIEHLDRNNLTENFEKKFLQGISLYIDDMRLLKNICNEFLIYYHRLNTTELNFNKMFAMITYKNLFPRDFSDLQNGRGYIKSLFEHKENFILSERERLISLIQVKKEEIDNCKNEQLVDLNELDVIKRNKEISANSYSYARKEYMNWLNDVYPIRKKAIEDKLKGRLPALETELIDLEIKLNKLESRQLKDIVNRENSKTIFHTTSVNEIGNESKYIDIRGSEYFALLKYLIGEGYIDETHADYMTYFYPNSLSVIDKKFLRSIRDKQAKEYTYSLKNPALILTYLNIADFEEPEILNFDLFEYVLNNNDALAERFIVQLKIRKKFDFLSQFFAMRKVKNSINKIIRYWPEFFFDANTDMSMPKKQIRDISLGILLYCDDKAIKSANVNNCLTDFVSKTDDYLSLTEVNSNRLIQAFELINVKFKSINYDVSEKNLYNLVYEKSMYILTYDNIKNMLVHIHGIEDEVLVKHKNYSTLLSISDAPIYNYVKANIAEYFEIVFETCEERIDDEEATIISVLNDESITDEIKKTYVTLLTNVVFDISQIYNHKFWSVLLEQEKLHFSENNLYYCFVEYKTLNALLINYINGYSEVIDIANISVESDNNFKAKIFDAAIKSFELSDTKYGEILFSSGIVCEKSFDVDNVPISKMYVLIDKGIIQMTKACLTSLRNKYTEVLFHFIRQNIEKYVDIMSSDIFVFSELEEILSWNICDEYKIILLKHTKQKTSVIGKNYGDKVLLHILNNNFFIDDLPHMLQTYNSHSEDIRTTIFNLSIENYACVLEHTTKLTELFVKELLACDRLDGSKRMELFIKLLPTISIEQAKMFALILNRNDLVAALEPNKRPRIPCNTQNKNILECYKQRTWICDYSANDSKTYYIVKKVKPIANRSVSDVLL